MINALCDGANSACYMLLPASTVRKMVCVCVCVSVRERIILGSPVWAFWNISNIYVHSNLGFNFLPQPLCLTKEEPAYLVALFLLFKLSLLFCHGCRSWPWLLPADWKGWLLDLYVTSLILETVWSTSPWLSFHVIYHWHRLMHESARRFKELAFAHKVFFTGMVPNMLLNSLCHWNITPLPSISVFPLNSKILSKWGALLRTRKSYCTKMCRHPRGKVTTCLCILNPMPQKQPERAWFCKSMLLE